VGASLSEEALAATFERVERAAVEQRRAPPPTPEEQRARETEAEIQRLVAGGFSRARAEHIKRRTEELQVAAMEAQFAARQSGGDADGVPSMDAMLRKELGDAEYEQLLRVQNRPTQVGILDVLASSAAERAGFRPGDQILSYGGTRVFEPADLNQLTMRGEVAQTVVVDIVRDGQQMQLVVPRGPLGVTVTAGDNGAGRGWRGRVPGR
jgi:predicted metalloprotease with PDZ domain